MQVSGRATRKDTAGWGHGGVATRSTKACSSGTRIAEYIKYMIIRPPTVNWGGGGGGGGEELYRDSNKVTNGVCVPTCLGAMPSAYGLCYRLGLTAIK